MRVFAQALQVAAAFAVSVGALVLAGIGVALVVAGVFALVFGVVLEREAR